MVFYKPGENNIHSVETSIGDKTVSIETGKLAKQADGAVTVQCGDTIILATVVAEDKLRENADFFPLTVDYREKTASVGRIPGGYIKREGRPTEKEILTCRLTDRPIRPLFPKGFLYETQIMLSVLSADGENDPDILAMIGASAALTISDIPISKPLGAVRVGYIDGEFVANPTISQLSDSELDFVVSGSIDSIVMVEGKANEVSEELLIDALSFAHTQIKKLVIIQEELQKQCGKEKRTPELVSLDETIYDAVKASVCSSITDAILVKNKLDRKKALGVLKKETVVALSEQFEDSESQIKTAFSKVEKEAVRDLIISKQLRADGRGPKDIRNIKCDVGFLPRTHGSALFTRGETQALVNVTLGSPNEGQRFETLVGDEVKNFMLHYTFPPFSVGECKPIRGPGRREIGHGILAERALSAVLPDSTDFPYVIRIMSDVLESNGSSSMASVCGGTLSLMDAGVPISAPVAGIAMGLVVEGDTTIILSDILGSEDACGDMDFKVAGTEEGITAFQLDLKIDGISSKIFKDALYQAKEGRKHILQIMNTALSNPRDNISDYAPRIVSFEIDPSKIGSVIGPGGKIIKKMIEDFQVSIDINDDGIVTVSSTDKQGVEDAVNYIKLLTAEVEVGKVYTGTVKNIVDFGAFVEVLPGKEGLLHISRLSSTRINHPSDVLSIGEKVTVRVFEVDDRDRINLELLIDGKTIERQERPRSSEGGRSHQRGSKPHYHKSGGFSTRGDKRQKPPYN